MKQYSIAALLLCALLCAALPASISAALAAGTTGSIVFCTETDSAGNPVAPGTSFAVNQKVVLVISLPNLDRRLVMELESRPDGTKTSAVWEAGASALLVDWKWEKPGHYTVTLYSKYTRQPLAEGEVTIFAQNQAQAQPTAQAPSQPHGVLAQAPPQGFPSVKPNMEQEPSGDNAQQTQKAGQTPPQIEPEVVPPARGKAPTSEEEEDFRPAPRFESAGWVYLEDVPEKTWEKNNLLSMDSDVDNLLITYSQVTFKKGFAVGHWTSRAFNGSLAPYVRRWVRERKGSLNYTLDVAGKYDRFRAVVGPGLWRMAPPNRQNSFGNVSILVDGVEEYKKRFVWNSRNEEIDIDLSHARTIQINIEGLEFAVCDPYFRKIE